MATIIVGTNSYATEAELATYAADRGITITEADTTILLIKAMDYLETRNFVGMKTESDQTLQWPREVCTGVYGCHIDNTLVPDDIKSAQMIAALIIDGGNEIQPTVERAVKKEKVDVLEVEYMDNAIATIQHTKLQDILRPYVTHTVRAVRV
jgi:hypothetical protein